MFGGLLGFLLLLSFENVGRDIEHALSVFFAHVAARIFAVPRRGTVLAEVVSATRGRVSSSESAMRLYTCLCEVLTW